MLKVDCRERQRREGGSSFEVTARFLKILVVESSGANLRSALFTRRRGLSYGYDSWVCNIIVFNDDSIASETSAKETSTPFPINIYPFCRGYNESREVSQRFIEIWKCLFTLAEPLELVARSAVCYFEARLKSLWCLRSSSFVLVLQSMHQTVKTLGFVATPSWSKDS